jgi:hypothetical protein
MADDYDGGYFNEPFTESDFVSDLGRERSSGDAASIAADRVNAALYHAWKQWGAEYAEWREQRGRSLSATALYKAKAAYGDKLEKEHGKRAPDRSWLERKRAWDKEHPGGHGW